MTTLSTGETLPEYDDGPADGIDINALWNWLLQNRPNGWRNTIGRDGSAIRDVLDAFQAVGDGTLVKNATYRLHRRDGADIERLAAYLTREGYAAPLVEHGGNPVTAIISIIGTDG